MLTVLHRGPDGSERLFEARSVTRFAPEGEQSVPATGIIRACGIEGEDVSVCIELDIVQPFGAVFVMNRFGATVARYTNP